MEKQWALVTGASSGIGFAYAKELASRGYPVVMVSNEEQAIQEKGEWIRKTYGVDVLTLYQDLAVPGAAKALFDICQEEEIIVDILVNNAGMFFLNEIVDEKEVKVEKMLYLHMTTPTQLCYYFGKEMKRRGIADIEFENFSAVGDHTVRLIEDGASYFITDIVQFRRFFYHFGLYPLTNSEYIARIAG